jgi:hypothetical protein
MPPPPHHCVVGERDCRGIGRTHKIVERVGYAGIERCERLSPVEFEPLGRRTPHRPLERPSASHFWLYEPLPRTLVQLTETDISLQIHRERGSEGRCGFTGPGEWARHDPHRCASGRQPRCNCVDGIALLRLDRLVCPSHYQPLHGSSECPMAHDVDH